MMLDWIQLIGGLVLLIGGGDFLVRMSVKLALHLNISSTVIGLTVVSAGTSFPELVVSVGAALGGHPDISLGNVVGSNIANIALVLGLTALFFPMVVQRSSVVFDWPFMLVATLVLMLFCWDLKIVFWEAALLFTGLVAYNVILIRASRSQSKADRAAMQGIEGIKVETSQAGLIRTLIVFALSIGVLIFGADILVEGAVGIARSFGLEERIIGLSIVAFGTSTPELATSLIAAFKKEAGISVGNLIGSNIFNILGILGVAGMIGSIDVNPQIFNFDLLWALGIPLLLYPLLLTRMKVSMVEGALLTAVYFTYLFLIF